MKEDLKLLAEWYEYEIMEDKATAALNIEGILVGYDEFYTMDFNPLKDANQLNKLEQKMIDEADICRVEFMFGDNRENVLATYYIKYKSNYICGEGKSIPEAKLNAVINYVKGVKKWNQ